MTPLIWVEAPAGSGKTTLAGGYAQARDVTLVWYRIDWADHDLASFFHFFRLAARREAAGADFDFSVFGPQYHDGLAAYARNFFAEVLPVDIPTLVVLDNFERLGPEHPLHALLAAAVVDSAKSRRWLVLSRQPPPPPLAVLAHFTIDWRDLRLSESESVRALALRNVPADIARQMHRKSNGWAAALRVMAERPDTGDYSWELEQLAEQSLEGYSQNERRMLERLSVLDEIDEAIASHLIGSKAKELLRRLSREQPLVEQISSRPLRLRMHGLLLDHLRAQLERTAKEADLDPRSVMQSYESVRAALLDRYGAPIRSFDQGNFGSSPRDEISSGQVGGAAQ